MAVTTASAFARFVANERRGWTFLASYALVSRLPLLAYPKACDDEQVYAVVAIEMLHGGRPYIDAVERKPPLLFYVYESILRIAGEHNYFALHLACVLWVLATMAFLYVIARRWFGTAAGFIAALLYAIFSAWADYSNLAFNGEIMMNLPIAAALAIAFRDTRARLRTDLFVVGALIAVAFLLKQPAVVAIVPVGLYVLHPEYRKKRALGYAQVAVQVLMLALGFALTLLFSAWWLYRVGVLREAWYWTIENHSNALGPNTWFFWHKLPLVGAWFVVESLPLLILAGWSLWIGFRREESWRQHRPEFVACVSLLLLSGWAVGYNGQFNFHYFLQLTPALALMAAPIAAELVLGQRKPRWSFLRPPFLVRWVGLLALLFLVVDTIGLARNREPHESAVYINSNSIPDDRIFMWGQGTQQTGLYLDAKRRPASRYIASFPLNGLIFGLVGVDTSHRVVQGSWDNLRSDFESRPPKFIVDCHEVRDGPHFRLRDYPFLQELVGKHYRLVLRAKDGVVYERIADPDRMAQHGTTRARSP